MKKKNLFYVLLVLAVCFISCDNGNEPNPDDGGENNEQNAEETDVRLVKQLKYYRENEELFESYEFNYDTENRLVEIKYQHNDAVICYSYPTENTIALTTNDGFSNTVTLNSDGSVAVPEIVYENGGLKKWEIGGDVVLNFEWKDGNVKTTTYKDSSNETLRTTSYEYAATKNKPTSIDFMLFTILVYGSNIDGGALPYKWYGKSTENLLSKVTSKRTDEKDVVKNFSYETDADGYVTKIYADSSLWISVQY